MIQWAAVMVLLAGCGGGGGTSSNPVITAAKTGGDAQTGITVGTQVLTELQVTVTENGVIKGGIPITWATTDGSVFPLSGMTDAYGNATTTWTLGTVAGTQHATATVGGVTGALTFSAIADPGPPALFTKTGGDVQSALENEVFPQILQVLVTDQYLNPINQVTVNWDTQSGSVAPDAPTSATNAQGLAIISVTAGGAGPAIIRASTAAIPARNLDFRLTVIPRGWSTSVTSSLRASTTPLRIRRWIPFQSGARSSGSWQPAPPAPTPSTRWAPRDSPAAATSPLPTS
jgi:hypothetical protein